MNQTNFPIGIHCQWVEVHGDGVMGVHENRRWCADVDVCRKDKNGARFAASIMMVAGAVPVHHGQRWKNGRGTDNGDLGMSRILRK